MLSGWTDLELIQLVEPFTCSVMYDNRSGFNVCTETCSSIHVGCGPVAYNQLNPISNP